MLKNDAEGQITGWIAGLLQYGTWCAVGLIAAGMVLDTLNTSLSPGIFLTTAGIALFIALPVLRLLLLGGFWLRRKDYLMASIVLCVLLIIGSGVGLALWR